MPRWIYSGLILLVSFIIFFFIWQDQKKEENAGLIEAPVKGDLYLMKDKNDQYTLYKVGRIDLDTVFVFRNKTRVNGSFEWAALKKSGNESYEERLIGFSKAELRKMFEDGTIEGVKRN